ncbi:MAG TPA: hypothetical protein VGG33_19090 [Polyangia bacterium]
MPVPQVATIGTSLRSRGVRLGVLLGALVFGRARPAAAVDVAVSLDPGPGAQYAEQVGLSMPQLETQVADELRRYFQLYRIDDFLRNMGEGQAFTSRGLGVDYASDFDLFSVGAGANLAFNLDSAYQGQQNSNKLVDFGRGINVSLMAGLNLAPLGASPFTLFVNYFSFSHDLGAFDVRSSNFGFHLQAQLLRSRGRGLVGQIIRWGGLDFTTGVEQEKAVLALAGDLTGALPLSQVSAAAAGANVRADAKGQVSFYTRAITIPFEVSTNLRLLRLLSLYAGVGYDLKVSSAVDGFINANAKLTGRVPNQNGGQTSTELGTAQVRVTHVARLPPNAMRVLGGVQLNLFVVKLFIHGNLLVRDPVLTSLGGGVRLAY